MTTLPTRTLGRTGLDVTLLGYGAMELREPPRGRAVPEETAGQVLNAVLDRGINFIDTSIDYGASEERIGRHIAHRRDEYSLATKCGCLVGFEFTEDGPGPHDYSRANIIAGVEQSLRRMRTDYVDLIQVHGSPSADVLSESGVIETLQDLQGQGKVRFIGMSGILPHLPDHIALGEFDVFQIPYSAVEREHEHLIAAAAAAGAGVIIRGGAAKGAPSGDDRPLQRWSELADAWQQSGLDELLDGMSPIEFTLRFTISHPQMTTTIVGTIDTSHLDANVRAVMDGPLPDGVYAEALRLLTAAGLTAAT